MRMEISTIEGSTVEMTAGQTARYDAGDTSVIGEIAAGLAPGRYSLYLADGGLLAENIEIGAAAPEEE